MNKIVRLVQGTEEWQRHRVLHRNASETAAVLGICPWMTLYQLWEVKTGRRSFKPTYPMLRGLELEPLARAAYEEETGRILEPVVMVRGDYSASLDGLSFDGTLILEVKCPMRGQESETWNLVQAGRVPEHYLVQVQHQLMVAETEAADLYVWDGKGTGITLRVLPDFEVQARIVAAWDDFWENHIVKDVSPPLTAADTVVRDDRAWGEAARAYLQAREAAEQAAQKAEAARQRLVELTNHTSERGYGVSVTRFWRGAKAAKEEVRVTVLKQEEERC